MTDINWKDPEHAIRTIQDLSASGDAVSARKHLNAAPATLRNDFRLIDLSARQYYTCGDAAASLQEYVSFLSENPGHVPALTNKGALLFEMQKWADALQTFQQAMTVKPVHPGVLANIASCLIRLNSRPEGSAAYKELVRRNPDFSNTSQAAGLDIQRAAESKTFPCLCAQTAVRIIRQVNYTWDPENQIYTSTILRTAPQTLTMTPPCAHDRTLAVCSGVSRLLLLCERKGFFFGAPVTVLNTRTENNTTVISVNLPKTGARIQRRKHLRVGVENIIESVRIIPTATGKTAAIQPPQLTARDLSAGGMSVLCPTAIPEQTALDLNLNLEGIPLSVHAAVTRCRNKEHGFEISLEFTDLSEADHTAISCFVLSKELSRGNPETSL